MAFFTNKESDKAVMGKHAKVSESSIPAIVPEPQGAHFEASATEPGYSMPKSELSLAAKVGIGVGVSLATLLIIVYGLGVFYFHGRFFPHTVIGDTDISMKSTGDLDRMLDTAVRDYTLQISGDDFDMTISSSSCGLKVDDAAMNQRVLSSMNPWAWPIEVFLTHDVTDYLHAEYDATAVEGIVKPAIAAHNENARPTEDATIAFDSKISAFSVKPEVYGTVLVEEPVMKSVDEALSSLDPKLVLGNEEVVQPKVFSTDKRLADAAAKATEMVKADITLMLGESEAGHVTGAISSQWVTLDDEINVVLDTDAMEEWVEEIAKTFDTQGSERKYVRPDGKECVVSGGDYGWKVDHEALIELVSQDMAEGVTVVEDVPVKSRAAAFNGAGAPDWGKRFIDVDLTEQFIRFYDEDGEVIWESDCVSGLPTKERSTPMGVYDLNDKVSPSVLRGYKPDGEVDYETKVSYWMPFKANSVGFHDASWQSSFGGDRYKSRGSHGCLNLPTDKAKELYELIRLNDVVSVHE